MRTALVTLLFLAFTAGPSLASFGGGSKPETPEPSSPPSSSGDASATKSQRQEAERWYGDAYDDVAKANKDVADGKSKNAEKRFKRALERGERAAGLDSTYHEAFNLIGYCARNLKLYDRSLAAYQRCLALKPDYAPAREYLGELYVETGDLDKAKEQLAWLEEHEAGDSAKSLRAKIDAKLPAKEAAKEASPIGTLTAAPDSSTMAAPNKP